MVFFSLSISGRSYSETESVLAKTETETDPKLGPMMWRWAVVQFAAIYCLVHAVFLFICGITRIGSGSTTTPYIPHMLLLAVLFYWLHWRLQDKAYKLDLLRSDRLVSIIKMRQSRYDPNW